MSVAQPPSTPTLPVAEEPPPMRCQAHPNVETLLRCGRCETPICTRCQVMTPVGVRCRQCAQIRRIVLVARPREIARAVALGTAVAAVGSLIVASIPFLGILGLAFLGFAVGEAVSIAVNRKRGQDIGVIAIACLAIGYAVGPLLGFLLRGQVPPVEILLLYLLGRFVNPLALLGLFIGGLLAWMRVR